MRTRRFALTCVGLGAFCVAFVAITAIHAGRYAVQELMREASPIAWLSTMLLVGAASVAVVLAMTGRGPSAFFALAGALVIAALDERFMGHEALKAFILKRAFHYDRGAMGHWGDLPMLGVPLVGGALVYWLRDAFRSRSSRAFLAAAFTAGVVAIALDIATELPLAQAVEEVLEVVAEALFLMALLAVADERR